MGRLDSQLAADAMLILKELKLITDDIFKIIPYVKLNNNHLFLPFYEAIKEKFETEIESKLTDKVITDLINDSLANNFTKFDFEKTDDFYLWSKKE
mgnify:CR=1 FL=1